MRYKHYFCVCATVLVLAFASSLSARGQVWGFLGGTQVHGHGDHDTIEVNRHDMSVRRSWSSPSPPLFPRAGRFGASWAVHKFMAMGIMTRSRSLATICPCVRSRCGSAVKPFSSIA